MKKILTEIELKRHIYKKVLSMLNEDMDDGNEHKRIAISLLREKFFGKPFEENRKYIKKLVHDKYIILKIPLGDDSNKKYFKYTIKLIPNEDYVNIYNPNGIKWGYYDEESVDRIDNGVIESELYDDINDYNKETILELCESIDETILEYKIMYQFPKISEEVDNVFENELGIHTVDYFKMPNLSPNKIRNLYTYTLPEQLDRIKGASEAAIKDLNIVDGLDKYKEKYENYIKSSSKAKLILKMEANRLMGLGKI